MVTLLLSESNTSMLMQMFVAAHRTGTTGERDYQTRLQNANDGTGIPILSIYLSEI